METKLFQSYIDFYLNSKLIKFQQLVSNKQNQAQSFKIKQKGKVMLAPEQQENRSSFEDSTDLFKAVRKFKNKKVIRQTDLRNLIKTVNQHHISALGTLSDIFIKLTNQLIFADHMWDKRKNKLNSDYKDKGLPGIPIPFSKYFHQQLNTDRNIFPQLYSCLHNKFDFYRTNSIAEYCIDEKDPYAKQISKRKFQLDERAIEYAYPQVYYFYQTLGQFVKNYQMKLFPNTNNREKQKLIHQMVKMKHNVQKSTFLSFKKPSEHILGNGINFGDQQFYNIASFIEKVKFQVNMVSKNGVLQNNRQQQFKSIPIQCIGCASMLYKGQSIVRDRSSMTRFEVVKSVKESKESKSRLKELIESFMNSPNGGVILFDCDDYLFEVLPRGFETNMKTYESRKQSILDSCKKYFKDFQVDKDFAIDFLILHDKNGRPIIHEIGCQKGLTKTQYFITRMKIFGRKITSEIKIADQAVKKSQIQINQLIKNQDVLTNQVGNYDMQSIDYEQMKMRFYKHQNIIKQIDKPEVYQKIQKAFYNNQKKMNSLIKGRMTKFFLHQNYTCKNSEIIVISNPNPTKQSENLPLNSKTADN